VLPAEQEVLQDYLKAIDLLTINDDKLTLQKQVSELKEKMQEEYLNYLYAVVFDLSNHYCALY
jgi:hypothetical protein